VARNRGATPEAGDNAALHHARSHKRDMSVQNTEADAVARCVAALNAAEGRRTLRALALRRDAATVGVAVAKFGTAVFCEPVSLICRCRYACLSA